MPDPTASVITATFSTAFGIFVLGAIIRTLLISKPPAVETGNEQEEFEVSKTPPASPQKGIPTYFYNPLDLLGLAFVFFLFFYLVSISVSASGDEKLAIDQEKLVTAIAFQFVCAMVVSAFVVFRVNPIKWLGLRWLQWKWVFLIAPGTVLLVWSLLAVLQGLGYMKWIDDLGVEKVQDTVKLLQESKDPKVVALMVIAAVVAAPICEEIVFRGYLYAAAKRFAGPWIAGICSALVFSAAHGSLSALLPLFIFGCILAFVYERTGSIWSTMAIHFCFNSATVVIQLAVRYYGIQIPTSP